MQATSKKIRKAAINHGAPKKVKRDVYADAWFTKKHNAARTKIQKEHEESRK
jgi:hypothetical protein